MPESIESVLNKCRGVPWELSPSVAYRDAIIGSGETGIVRWSSSDWPEHSHLHALIVFPSAPALCELIWSNAHGSQLNRNRIEGRHACFIGPDVPHAACWGSKAEMLLILIRPSFVQRELGRTWRTSRDRRIGLSRRQRSNDLVADFTLLASVSKI
jgi:hypothetical protein